MLRISNVTYHFGLIVNAFIVTVNAYGSYDLNPPQRAHLTIVLFMRCPDHQSEYGNGKVRIRCSHYPNTWLAGSHNHLVKKWSAWK